MSLTLTLLRDTLARLHVACEALGIHPDDIRMHDFTEDEQARFASLANEDIRREINRYAHPLEKPCPVDCGDSYRDQ